MMSEPLTKEEFCRRFKAHLISLEGDTFADGESIAGYADEVGPTYWEDQHQDGLTPEDCAEADIDNWE